MLELAYRSMACAMQVSLDASGTEADRRIACVPNWFIAWENRLSRFIADSELCRLNDSAGEWVKVSQTLWDVLTLALKSAEDSEGLLSPALLTELEAAGYDRSFELVGAASGKPRRSRSLASWRDIQMDADQQAVCLRPGLRIDLGGFAKGWAADRAAHRLSAVGPAMVDAGGDVAVSGPQANGNPWPVTIADPVDPDRDLIVLRLDKGGVATSGIEYRRWRRGDSWSHHLIDPRTGTPAGTDLLSATIVGPSAAAAEAAAKIVMLRGLKDGSAWLEVQPTLAGLLVDQDGAEWSTRNLDQYVWQP